MAVGQGAVLSMFSYYGFGRETVFGTGVTSTAGLKVISSSLKVEKENKVLEQIERNRVYSQRIGLGKVVSGEMEFYVDPDCSAVNYILQNAFGGAITSATATGETAGGLGFLHTYAVGSIQDASYTSLSLNHRKGDSTNGQVFEYIGGRVNQVQLMAELDEALKMNAEIIFKDVTMTSNDIESALVGDQSTTISFVGGRFSVEGTFASLTASSFWHVQGFNLTINNNLKSDAESRRIGSDVLSVLPSGVANIQVTCQIRWDTTTAIDAMLAGTKYSLELEFQGDTMAGSAVKRGIKLQMPVVYVNTAGDPEIGGPDEILTSEVVFDVLRDISSSTGYAIKALVTNLTSSYA